MRVHVKNIEPCWVEYGYVVEVEDGLTDGEAKGRALTRIYGGGGEIVYGPEVICEIESMDQEYEITEIER